MLRVLFVCGKNKWRSPTAEHIFASHSGIECASAGLAPESETVLSAELIEWAELIFVMEKQHKSKLSAQFKPYLADKRVVCLHIPDKYHFMDATLVKILTTKVTPYLPVSHGEGA
jgi:predicted protein tyrosine phosphatase